tara:strand:- start:8798 stop:9535 length:738 start_codon:yes stop_codon:yes gene_type:complete
LDAKDVVVGREHVEGGAGIGAHAGLNLDGNLGVVDAGEVASAGRLMLLGLKRERIRIDAGHGAARVVVVGLHGVEVLTGLLLEPVLTVEDKLEGLDGADGTLARGTLLNEAEGGGTSASTGGVERNTGGVSEGHEAVGVRTGSDRAGANLYLSLTDVGGEVPKLGTSGIGGSRGEHELLDGVVVREADLLGLADGEGINTSVLNLLNEVLVTLLGETPTLLSVEVHVVTPNLEGVKVEVGVEFGS